MNRALAAFDRAIAAMNRPRVLELGAKRTPGAPSSLHRHWVPGASEFVGTDYQAGEDVDVVADVHSLSETFGAHRFDAIICCSTFEHIKYPWIAALEIARCLRMGGVVFVQTHQSYPIHGAPFDYWRFSSECLANLFSVEIGMSTLAACHEFPCQIQAHPDHGPLETLPAFLNSCLCSVKVGETPVDWAGAMRTEREARWIEV